MNKLKYIAPFCASFKFLPAKAFCTIIWFAHQKNKLLKNIPKNNVGHGTTSESMAPKAFSFSGVRWTMWSNPFTKFPSPK